MSQLTLNLETGSVSFELPAEAVRELKATLDEMMVRLKAGVQAGVARPGAAKSSASSRRSPQRSVEYRYRDDLFLEMFCNPNIWPSPFAAKVLVTLRDDRLRLSTEAELSQVFEDVNQCLEASA